MGLPQITRSGRFHHTPNTSREIYRFEPQIRKIIELVQVWKICPKPMSSQQQLDTIFRRLSEATAGHARARCERSQAGVEEHVRGHHQRARPLFEDLPASRMRINNTPVPRDWPLTVSTSDPDSEVDQGP